MKKNYSIFVIGVLGITFVLMLSRYFSKPLFEDIPISFTSSREPLLMVKIEENTYKLTLDLGSKFPLTLGKETLETLTKKHIGNAKWRDAKGKSYESPFYNIGNIHIGSLNLKNVHVRQESDDYVANTTYWNSNTESEEFGMIGRPILEKINLLLDSPHSKIIATNDKQMLKEAGYDLDLMVKIPITIDQKGMIVNVETDVGTLRFVLDTGSTLTLVRSSSFNNRECSQDSRGFSVYESSEFVMGQNDFGKKKLYLYDLAPEVKEVDGLLGMDFFETHVIYFDYVHKCIYIRS